MWSFMKWNPQEMVKSLCHLLMKVNHVIVTNFYIANVSFNAIRENKIVGKISEFTVNSILKVGHISEATTFEPENGKSYKITRICWVFTVHTIYERVICSPLSVAWLGWFPDWSESTLIFSWPFRVNPNTRKTMFILAWLHVHTWLKILWLIFLFVLGL